MLRGTWCLAAGLLALQLIGCGAPPAEERETEPSAVTAGETPRAAAAGEEGVILVRAEEYAFTAPPTFPSGWARLRFDNRGEEEHFLVLVELPEGRSFDDYVEQISRPFDEHYARYRAGEVDQDEFLEQLVAALPEWFFTARRAGGPGFTSPGRVSETSVHLEPGDYVMECYVRAMGQSDTFHGSHGMLRPLIVREEPSGLAEPAADVEIRLSNYAIDVEGEMTAGSHVARVVVEESPEGPIFHNVHLAKLEEGQRADRVAAWLNWVDEMLPPAPAELLGGAGQMTVGGESYFHFDLEPGRWAWVSETYGPRGMVHEFVVE